MERNTAIKTYSIDQEIAEQFKKQTPDQKTSQELEKLMAEYIDEDMTDKKPPIKLLDRNVVTQQRRKIIEILTENNYWKKTGPQLFEKVKNKGMYKGDSGSHHFKKAMKFLDQYDESYITRENGKIVAEQFRCMDEGCDAEMNLKILGKKGMQCPTCSRTYKL